MRFGTDKCVSPEVVAHVAANMECEMVAALVIGATTERAAGKKRRVKAQILTTNAGHRIRADFLLECLSHYRIKVVENGPIGLKDESTAVKSAVGRLPGPPGNFTAETNVVFEQKNSTEAGIKPTADRKSVV